MNNDNIVRGATVPGTNDGSFAPHSKSEADTSQVQPAAAPSQRHLDALHSAETQMRKLQEREDQLWAKIHTHHLAHAAAQILADDPDATYLQLVPWEEEVDDFGGYEITYGEVLDADGEPIGDARGYSGSISSQHLGAHQPWADAYVGGAGEYWGGRLDLRKLIAASEQLVEQDAIPSHLDTVCAEAGLPTMAEVLGIVRDRAEVEDSALEELTADDIEELYTGWVGPAVDNIERSLLGDYD